MGVEAFLREPPPADSTMQAITLNDVQRDLPRLVAQVLADAEARIVVDDRGEQVVLMPLDEFNSWRETLHLLGNSANAARLRESIAQAEAGLARPMGLIGE